MTPGGERVASAILAAGSAGRAAIAAYLTSGFPSRASFPAVLREVAGSADVIEIGVPFSDPIADGVTIQHASRIALADATTLRWTLRMLAASVPSLSPPVVLMSYVNPLLAYGLERLAHDAAEAGIRAVIVPDLPLEEQGRLSSALNGMGLALVQMSTPTSSTHRLERIGAVSDGFVYAVTVAGTTGGRIPPRSELARYLERVRAVTRRPVLAGFGVRTSADVASLVPPADGVVVGSALIAAIERGESPARFLAELVP